jgi:uncharacterized protein DUF6314
VQYLKPDILPGWVGSMSETISRSRWGNPGEVIRNLSGRWSFDRTIEGHGAMKGVATFTALDQGSLLYREQGNLKLAGGTELHAEREYIYRVRQDGFDVLFRESPPRLFHAISLAQHDGSEYFGNADHLCGPDTYRSTYTFLADGNFVIRHIVHGPRKDYTMVTTYSRG